VRAVIGNPREGAWQSASCAGVRATGARPDDGSLGIRRREARWPRPTGCRYHAAHENAVLRRVTTALDPWGRWHIVVSEAGSAQPLCVALANTLERRDGTDPFEHLQTGADIVRFASTHGLCDDATARALAARAAAHPRVARAELAATVALREAIARILRAPDRSEEADLELLARSFDEAQRSLAVELRGGKLAARPRVDASALDLVRMQAAVSAVALLASPDARRVRRCADDRGCGRLFLDTTRNGSRRFCMAAECGNRARQAAFRARKRAGGAKRDR